MPFYELTIPPELEGAAIRRAATGLLGLSSRQFKRCKFQGEMRLDGETVHADTRRHAGQRLWLYAPERDVPQPEASEIPLKVYYEDDHLLVVNKPAGVETHPSQPGQSDTLLNGVAFHLMQEGTLCDFTHIHRLDKDTTGALLFAKHPFAAAILHRMLEERLIKRT